MGVVLKATIECDHYDCGMKIAAICHLGFDSRQVPDLLPILPEGWQMFVPVYSDEKKYYCNQHHRSR